MYQCSHCQTKAMNTADQYEIHIKSQKHVKKAFQLQAPFDGIEYPEFRRKVIVKVNDFVPTIDDFPSLSTQPCVVAAPTTIQYLNIVENLTPAITEPSIVEVNENDDGSEDEDTITLMDDIFFKEGARIKNAKQTIDSYYKNNKTACAALNEIAVLMYWVLDFKQVAGDNRSYRYSVSIDTVDLAFGEGDNKKEAKQEASCEAIKVIRKKLKEGRRAMNENALPSNGVAPIQTTHVRGERFNMHLQSREVENPADAYCRLTIDKLLKIESHSHNKFVIPRRYAAFIMTDRIDQLAKDGVVVAFGAGNGNLKRSEKQRQHPGYYLTNFDSLVVAKRSFQCFLYNQLMLLFDKTIKTKKIEKIYFDIDSKGMVKLKDGCRVHLFMSHAPHGDCVDSLPRDWQNPKVLSTKEIDRDKSGFVEPIMLMKYNCDKFVKEPGHIRIVNDDKNDGWISLVHYRSATKVVADHMTMSPTDKLMTWIHIGLQGALLSHLMDPVYLYSVQVANDYMHEHFSRALICRVPLEKIADTMDNTAFKDPFIARVTKLPEIVQPLLGLVRQNVSINWYSNHVSDLHEIIDNETGLVEPCSPFKLPNGDQEYLCSRLAKVCMLVRLKKVFKLAVDYFAMRPELQRTRSLQGIGDAAGHCYHSFKISATQYRSLKQCLFQVLSEKSYGDWAPNNSGNNFDLLQYYVL